MGSGGTGGVRLRVYVHRQHHFLESRLMLIRLGQKLYLRDDCNAFQSFDITDLFVCLFVFVPPQEVIMLSLIVWI